MPGAAEISLERHQIPRNLPRPTVGTLCQGPTPRWGDGKLRRRSRPMSEVTEISRERHRMSGSSSHLAGSADSRLVLALKNKNTALKDPKNVPILETPPFANHHKGRTNLLLSLYSNSNNPGTPLIPLPHVGASSVVRRRSSVVVVVRRRCSPYPHY